jgi:hypothetical protein
MARVHPQQIQMKLPHTPRGGRSLVLGIACLGLIGTAFAQQELIPRGKLTVDKTLVRVGAQSQLQWQIQYPDNVTNIVGIVTPQTIVPKKELQMRVRVIGSGEHTVKTDNGHGNNLDGYDSSNTGNKAGTDASGTVDDERKVISSKGVDLPVEAVWSKNNSDFTRIYYGKQSAVIPTAVVLDTMVNTGDVLNFGARAYTTKWLPLHTTATSSQNVLVLKNGDTVPKQLATKQYGQILGYLKPYLSTDGKKVKIGDSDLLVLLELDQTNPLAVGFDYQDLGLLVTFN